MSGRRQRRHFSSRIVIEARSTHPVIIHNKVFLRTITGKEVRSGVYFGESISSPDDNTRTPEKTFDILRVFEVSSVPSPELGLFRGNHKFPDHFALRARMA